MSTKQGPGHRRPIKTSSDQVREIKLEEWAKAREILNAAKIESMSVWDPVKKEWVIERQE